MNITDQNLHYIGLEQINEVLLSNFNEKNIHTTKLFIDQPSIVIVIPDKLLMTENKYIDALMNCGLLLSNCGGIIADHSMISVHNKDLNKTIRLNGKNFYYDLKKQLTESKSKYLKALLSPPKSDTDKIQYFFYDGTIYSEYFDNLQTGTGNNKRNAETFFEELNKLYLSITKKFPNCNIYTIFIHRNNDSKLKQLFESLRRYIAGDSLIDDKQFKFSNKFCFVNNNNNCLIPIINFENIKSPIILKNLSKLDYNPELISQSISPTSDINIEDTINVKTLVNTDDYKKIQVKDDGKIVSKLNRPRLNMILDTLEITDPDLKSNIDGIVSKFIIERKIKRDELTEDELKLIVLKSINYTINGTVELSSETLNNPKTLVKKLKTISAHKVALKFPDIYPIFKPTDYIEIDHTTGVWRQKKEFEETIHKNVNNLFKSLEQVSLKPIKIKNIDYEIIDDDINRLIQYKVTLQNTDGGKTEDYDIILNVPGLVNDRYFKLNGSSYIMATQQFLKPVTKTTPNEVRILSNYAQVHLELENVKFDLSDVDKIMKYIIIRYPSIISKSDNGSFTFFDDSVIHLSGSTVYTNKKINIIEDEYGDIRNSLTNKKLNQGKYEFLYDIIKTKLAGINKNDRLTKTSKSIPYISIYLGGFKVPLILYLWQLKGLLTTLNDLDIDYKISDIAVEDQSLSLKMKNGKFLIIYPNTFKEETIVNGLLMFKYAEEITNVDSPEEIYPLMDRQYGSRTIYTINLITQNEIDPITKDLLEFEDLPNTLPKLITDHCIDKLLNGKIDKLSDLKIYRARLSEMVLQLMYKQIKMAHNEYVRKVNVMNDQKAQIQIDPDYIIRDIVVDAGVLQHTEPVNPIDELFLASKTIKTGKGGNPNKRTFKLEHRNIHRSHYGIMSANATPESSGVGLIVAHTLTPIMVSEYGHYGYREPSNLTPWNVLAANEAIVPFQNEVDSDRMVMAATHINQSTPTDGNQAPIVCSGGEYIIPQLASKRFIHIAKEDGVVVDVVKDKYITVKYASGQQEVLDIIPRMSRTKLSAVIYLNMKTLQQGHQFKSREVIAATNNFDNGVYASGRNCWVALFNRFGMCHEDSYVVSNNMATAMTRDIINEITVIIPPNTKVMILEKMIGKIISKQDTLVEFIYPQDLTEYLTMNQISNSENQEADSDDDDIQMMKLFQKNEDSIKLSGIQGEIVDIKIYINNKNTIDKVVNNLYNEKVAETNDVIEHLSESIVDKKELIKARDNINLKFFKIGGHKLKGGVEFLGAKIVYYVKEKVDLQIGDKIANRFGGKGTIGAIDKLETKSEMGTVIDVFLSGISVFSRKNLPIIKELYLGKIIYYLYKKTYDMANNPKIKSMDIIKLYTDIYSLLLDNVTFAKFRNNINEIGELKFRDMLKSGELKPQIIVSPFKSVTFKQIKTAASVLNIPLDEKVFIPEMNTWTKSKVPVGIGYYQALEHISKAASNIRSVGKYQGLTRQATKGKSREGGQSIGNLDIYALLTMNVPSLMDELITVRTDEHKSKRQVINDIMFTGSADLPSKKESSETLNVISTFMLALGLSIT